MKTKTPPGITSPKGFRAAGGTCGIKASGKPDLTLILADAPCVAAAVFTVSRMPGPPVQVGRRHLRSGQNSANIRAIICNSGNANASTGKQGLDDAITMCRLVAAETGCEPGQVLPSSTGIIGRPLPMAKIAQGIGDLAQRLDRGPKADAAAARGIMTTDLVPKGAHRTLRLGGKTVTLAGICKGSGMIAPNMATMLAFVTTDAAIAPAALRKALTAATGASFNRISVDQHCSPSDTLAILASGAAGNATIAASGKAYDAFAAALTDLCSDMAYQVVKDGEGATRVFRVRVLNARNEREADLVGAAIVNSPLVKTAVHGGDPNWGRITTAAGYSGTPIVPEKMSLYIGPKRDIPVYRLGQAVAVDKTTLRALGKLMKAKEVVFTLDLGMGKACVEWLGCDLSREYIAINADYTT
ncbi:MAG: bifunctional glutamate N-acetyltransferase/amino-acid acetyltransferase ArgJ [Planctomycetota bacterium]|nr:bifunctional glutamate N-acetyltransferase/amino-acid acetyltransferase ArgJ [Planctomycetota bacterium]